MCACVCVRAIAQGDARMFTRRRQNFEYKGKKMTNLRMDQRDFAGNGIVSICHFCEFLFCSDISGREIVHLIAPKNCPRGNIDVINEKSDQNVNKIKKCKVS